MPFEVVYAQKLHVQAVSTRIVIEEIVPENAQDTSTSHHQSKTYMYMYM